jgi:glycosyltransferase involved in cell wall biosynthesis
LELIEGYANSSSETPLVVVGAAKYGAAYTEQIRKIAEADPRIRLLGSIYDQDHLNYLYANALSYWHGHSVGGTNPSLLRALGAGTPVVAHDNEFNREVAGAAGLYVTSAQELTRALDAGEVRSHIRNVDRKSISADAMYRYSWDAVATGYEQLVC